VWGIPEVWTDADSERDPWLHVLVRVQGSEPPEVWELVIHHPDERDGIRLLGCELRRLLPDPVGDCVQGCIDFARGSVALFCDHAVTPHQPKAVSLSQSQGMFELWDAFVNEYELELEDIAACFRERLTPLAVELVARFRPAVGSFPLVKTPFSFLPDGEEWRGPDDWEEKVAGGFDTHVEWDDILVPGGTNEDGSIYEWSTHDLRVEGTDEDHGWYSACGDSNRPGGDWVFEGWLTWADGTLLAAAAADDDIGEPPEANRITLPGLDSVAQKSPDWWLGMLRALTLGGSQWPREW
jgi:hypothetical protein